MSESLRNHVITGNCLEVMAAMPDGGIDLCVTSPPYWGLRDYGIPATEWPEVTFSPMPGLPAMTIPAECSVHGLEKNIWTYVGHEVLIFREVRRLLVDHGTLFLNLGDSYNSRPGQRTEHDKAGWKQSSDRGSCETASRNTDSLKPKDLCGIPWRVAYALQADGWWLRQDIVWAKKSPMPESVTDRCTKAHEYIFLLTKSTDYYWDREAIKEEAAGVGGGACIGPQNKPGLRHIDNGHGAIGAAQVQSRKFDRPEYRYRNCRSVWTFGPEPCKDAHFATFPSKIPERCILAGCPKEVCTVCGKPRERITQQLPVATKAIGLNSRMVKNRDPAHAEDRSRDDAWDTRATGKTVGVDGGVVAAKNIWANTKALRAAGMDHDNPIPPSATIGWTDCGCGQGFRPGRVLDPFGGSGTVGYVAAKLKRDWLLIELNPKYVEEIASYKLQEAETGLPAEEAKVGQLGLFTKGA